MKDIVLDGEAIYNMSYQMPSGAVDHRFSRG